MKFESDKAPKPVGAYPHARKAGNLLFLSGVGPRKRNSNEIPGVELDKDGNVFKKFQASKWLESLEDNDFRERVIEIFDEEIIMKFATQEGDAKSFYETDE